MTGEPRYRAPEAPLLALHNAVECLDCGALVTDEAAHTRFHSILSAQHAGAEDQP